MRDIPNVRHEATLMSLLIFPDIASCLSGQRSVRGPSPLGIRTLDATLTVVVGAKQDRFAAGAAAARQHHVAPSLAAFASYLDLVGGRRGRAAGEGRRLKGLVVVRRADDVGTYEHG